MKKRIPLIIFILFLVSAVGFGIWYYFHSKTKFNDSYVNGNSAGNLYNAGLFCENGGTIFFANPSDEYRLYSMDTDGENLVKLCDDVVSFINADDHYVYYVRNNPRGDTAFSFLSINTNSLCRIDRTGGDTILVLDTEPSMYASLVGDFIYYIRYDKTDTSSLYKVRIDGKMQEQVDKSPYYTCSAAGQYLYYNGLKNDHNIWQLDTASDMESMVYGGNCWMPIAADGSTFYYMDCDNNYKLAKTDIVTGEKVLLGDDRVDSYNVSGNDIFVQRNSPEHPALCRMNADGTGYEVISEGIYTEINTAGGYVYFRDFKTGIMYRTTITPGGSIDIFDPGKA